jgi:hypothetical protein
MDDSIIGIATKWKLRMIPFHPDIKHIVQKKIGQHRAYHTNGAKSISWRLN